MDIGDAVLLCREWEYGKRVFTQRCRSHSEIRVRSGVVQRKKHLTSATKLNGISIMMPYWDACVPAMVNAYPIFDGINPALRF